MIGTTMVITRQASARMMGPAAETAMRRATLEPFGRPTLLAFVVGAVTAFGGVPLVFGAVLVGALLALDFGVDHRPIVPPPDARPGQGASDT
jgi:hypothetical protein